MRKIAQATYVSQVTTGVPVIVDTPIIGFQKKDLIGLDLPHNDALVICIQIKQVVIERVHVDEGCAANILQLSVIQQMGLEPKISKLARSLIGFNEATSVTVETIDLDVQSPPVVYSQTLMGRPWISKIVAIISAQQQKIRYPILGGGIGQINSDQSMARRCTAQGLKKSKQLQFTPVMQAANKAGSAPNRQLDKQEQIGSRQNPNKKDRDEGIHPEGSLEEGWKPEEDVELVPLNPDQPDKKAHIGSRLSPDEKVEVDHLPQEQQRHKRRNFAPERVVIIEVKIDKLLAARFIEEVSYSEWLANVVLVAKQENGKWRVCVDYTDVNEACPKDNFPLPRIDQLMDSTSGNQLLNFMDVYFNYNQIMMYDDDKAKTSFIIERGFYCYKVMPFGLKNAGATYQRLVNKIFKEQIGRTMEVYVDDMLVKAPKHGGHLKNLTKLVPGEDLFVYLAMSNSAVSLALIREELRTQHPIFYTSKALLDADTHYPKLEKLILALVVSARKLRPYYQAH
ncbi:uncharacterized protein LOC109946503 [Prunus persica]|uniref:uncharacterized protein LOC109946503 n=1 Tax=Prunus persica TaxID=3760 RepID=UPI0009AB31F1|nr:uncharacterized protein LOC109946503 [Prunus persica]